MGVQKDEMCMFAAPAHNKKRPSGGGVIMRSDRSCVLHALRTKESKKDEGNKTKYAYLLRLRTKAEGGQAGSPRCIVSQFKIKSRIARACAQE